MITFNHVKQSEMQDNEAGGNLSKSNTIGKLAKLAELINKHLHDDDG